MGPVRTRRGAPTPSKRVTRRAPIPTLRRRRGRAGPRARALQLAFAVVLAAGSLAHAAAETAAPTESVEVEVPLSDGRVLQAPVDRSLLELRDRLRSLTGEEPESAGPLDPLFSIPLDRSESIEVRIPILEAEIAQLAQHDAQTEAQLTRKRPGRTTPGPDAGESAPPGEPGVEQTVPEPPSHVASELAQTRVREEIAKRRRDYLRALTTRLAQMPEPAQEAFAQLGSPRTSLRARAAAIREGARNLHDASTRLEQLAARLAAGGLVGFVVEARELQRALEGQARSLQDRSEQVARHADGLDELADEIEIEGAEVRRLFLTNAAHLAKSSRVDARFSALLEEQRDLRRLLRDVGPGARELPDLRRRIANLAADPRVVGTTGQARQVADEAISLVDAVDTELAAAAPETAHWRLAYVNEAVSVLATRISAEERKRAYALSSEMISDVRSEASVAWGRALSWGEDWRETAPDPSALFVTERGLSLLLRGLGIGATILGVVVVRRRSGRIVVKSVRWISRLEPMRPHLGSLVRWAGLFQTVLPVLLLLPAYWILCSLLGAHSTATGLLRAVFLPFFLYLLGRETLTGATRQITRGRPALVKLSPETRERARLTYARLGLIFAVAATVDSLAELAIGPGRIVSLVDVALAAWVVVWAAWAAFAWRAPLARSWAELRPDEESSREHAVARWMASTPLGFALSPIALALVASTRIGRAFAGRLSASGLAQRTRAMYLRRRSRRSEEVDGRRPELPAAYLEEFPLYPLIDDKDAVVVPRAPLVESILEQLGQWRETRASGSLVLVGEKGIGKTTLAAMVARRIEGLELVTHTLRGTLLCEEDLVGALAPALGHAGAGSTTDLAERLNAGPERVVVIDEAHFVFLRVVGGYRAYDALVSLVNATPDKVFWILVFNRYTWTFLNESRARVHYFRRVLELPAWTSAEIQDLIRRRTTRAGFRLVFSEILRTDEIGGSADIDLIDGSEAYFRLLWESSGGNPRIASRLWLDSLTAVSPDTLEVGLFNESPPRVLAELGDDLVFTLAAVAQRENLSPDELARSLNMPAGFADFAVRFLSEEGLVEPKEKGSDRVTLAPRNYHHVLRALRNRHLLLE